MTDRSIEVFIADIRQPEIQARCGRLYPHLSDREREKADRFLREDDRLRFITGRLMIRKLAAERLGMSSPDILLTEYGKPYIGGADGFHFSISHSGDLVVIALSDASVGVDIERNVPIKWREISETFGAKERKILESSKEPLTCFYRIWTIREAFSKKEGLGLSLFESGSPDINYENGTVHYRGKTLYFTAWEKDGYSVCVCGSRAGDPIIDTVS